MEHDILAVAHGLFAREGYDATTVERIAAESGVTVEALHRSFPSKDATLAVVGVRSVERALEDLPPAPSMAELARRLADAFDASFRRDGAGVAFRSIRDHPSIEERLPVWRHWWATQLAHGLAAHAGREGPDLRDRVVSSMAMEVVGVGLDEWLHHPGDASLPEVVLGIVSRLNRGLGRPA
ncbi:MAG: TetR/AcrR family transcriptional regulator [Actinobacteria bacterium]|nr:TetR/AcrR family transcriptional regulator [Actinomycetota bacterium]